jgi:hypothetical protein
VTPLDIEYTPAERDQALQDGISFAEKLNTSQGASRFRVMVLTAALMRSVQLPSRLRHCGSAALNPPGPQCSPSFLKNPVTLVVNAE